MNIILYTRYKNRDIIMIIEKDISLRNTLRKHIGHNTVQNNIKLYMIV